MWCNLLLLCLAGHVAEAKPAINPLIDTELFMMVNGYVEPPPNAPQGQMGVS